MKIVPISFYPQRRFTQASLQGNAISAELGGYFTLTLSFVHASPKDEFRAVRDPLALMQNVGKVPRLTFFLSIMIFASPSQDTDFVSDLHIQHHIVSHESHHLHIRVTVIACLGSPYPATSCCRINGLGGVSGATCDVSPFEC